MSEEARAWLGTPYRHQASIKHVGVDCLGLVRGVWRACIGAEPEVAPPYTPDWAEVLEQETLLQAARRHMVEIPTGHISPGDVLLFRMAIGAPAKHCGILTSSDRMIHAYWGRAVVETRLSEWWRRRLVAAFRFPDVKG